MKNRNIYLILLLILTNSCNEVWDNPYDELADKAPPLTKFSVSKTVVLEGEVINFTDDSENEPNAWEWNFGDGNTSTDQNPVHSYDTSGTYTVSFTATNNHGSNTETKEDYIIVNKAGSVPIASFIANKTEVVEGNSVTFTDLSSNIPTSWNWSFGDGGTSTEQNPVYTYENIGNYTVTLTVTNDHGNDTETKENYITVTEDGVPPTADFSADKTTIYEGEKINFTDQSTNNPTAWEWNFGDGGTSNEQNPNHTYNDAGIYTVQLKVTNEFGDDTEIKVSYIEVKEDVFGTLTDIDGNTYVTVLIGNQTWMAENLKTTRLPNGNNIPQVINQNDWDSMDDPYNDMAYCFYNNYNSVYGALYTWATASNVCPDGWHLPSQEEFEELENYVNVNGHFGVEGTALKSTTGWNDNGNGTDSFGFNGKPGGSRDYGEGWEFYGLGYDGSWWTTHDVYENSSVIWSLESSEVELMQYGTKKLSGHSVRCIKD